MLHELNFPELLPRLQKSKFRSQFQFDQKDLDYIEKVGMGKIRQHAQDFIEKRLAPENPPNDGRQTPFKGHPIFKAQHATATCCRSCLLKWHGISKNRNLTAEERQKIVAMLIEWIEWKRNSRG